MQVEQKLDQNLETGKTNHNFALAEQNLVDAKQNKMACGTK